MTSDNPSTPPAPRWPYTDEPVELRQDALPIPEAAAGEAISYPSDPTGYQTPPEAPQASTWVPEDSPPVVGRSFVDPQEPPARTLLPPAAPPPARLPAPAPARRRTGLGKGLLLGLVLGAIIAVSAFGLGRITAPDDEPVAVVQTTLPTTSLVGTIDPPPKAVVPPGNSNLEPVAAAAAAVTPAVVQIDTSFGTGSGVIYDEAGYILTAAHVIGNAGNVTVRFADGSRTNGTVVGADELTDVAVVSIEPDSVPAIAVLAVGADLSVGQTAVAVGTPFGLDQTVTSGIISAVDRLLETNGISMVQTDAAINPGNSGGPLVDLNGHVIGINDVIFTNSGDNAGVGFAISIDLAKIVADQLVAGEPVSLARLGVSAGASPDGDAGALIQSVSEGTAAADAGLEVGDLVISLDGDPVRDSGDLRAEVITRPPGTTIEIVVVRDGRQITITAVLGAVSTN